MKGRDVSSEHKVPWEAEPHTKVKHQLYRRYLSKWLPIMVSGWGGNITYAEGFAGPGVYIDGSPGSPVIALRSLIENERCRRKVKDCPIRFIFVDKDQRCIDLLPKELTKAAQPVQLEELAMYGINLTIAKGECEPTLDNLLREKGAWGRPILAVLDTWGAAVSRDLVRRLARNPGTEVVITMQPQYFTRFAESADIRFGDQVFGDIEWRRVAELPSHQKARWLLEKYRNCVQNAGFNFVLDFELIPLRGQPLYLVFGTNHRRGLEKMKEAMWEVDGASGVGYRDPRDPGQESLEIEILPNTGPLKRLIVRRFRSRISDVMTVAEIRNFALFETVFKESQATSVVRELIDEGILRRCNGNRGRRLALNDPVELTP